MNKYKFSDIVIGDEGLLRGPFGSDLKKSLYVLKGENTYKVYSQDNILQENINLGDRYISKEYYDSKMYRYEVKNMDFIITCDGTLGEIYQLKDLKEPGIISSSLLRVRLNPEIVDYNYFYYLFKILIKNQLIRKGNNSVLKHLPGINVIKKLEIELPDLSIQKKIGMTLSHFDSKINTNNSIIEKLNEICTSTYNYWFLQYNFPNKNNQEYSLNGGELVWNNELKRNIPKGWVVKSLRELIYKNTQPFDYRKTVNTLDLSVMNSSTMVIKNINSSSNFSTNLFKMKKGDILFGSIRPYLKKGGLAPFDGAVAGTVLSYSVYEEYLYNFILFTMINDNFFSYAVSRSKGTKMPVISNDDILDYKVPYNKDIVEKFNNIMNFKEIYSLLVNENLKIMMMRDYLLPLIMNGQVTINE